MQNDTLSKYTVAFGLSLALSSVANALLVMAKEKSPAVQSEMQKLTGSHWVTHVAVVLVLFFVCGWLLAGFKGGRGALISANGLIKIIVGGVVVAGAMIVGFYLVAD